MGDAVSVYRVRDLSYTVQTVAWFETSPASHYALERIYPSTFPPTVREEAWDDAQFYNYIYTMIKD